MTGPLTRKSAAAERQRRLFAVGNFRAITRIRPGIALFILLLLLFFAIIS